MRHVPAQPPRVVEVVRLADRAEPRRRERDRHFRHALIAEQEIGERGRPRRRHAREGTGGAPVEAERPARELIAVLVELVEPDRATQLERVRAADPGQVVDELEHLVAVGVRALGAVAEAVVSRDADGRNAPRLRWSRRDAGNGQLGHDVARVGQLAAERVEEGVEPEAELVEHRRRDRARVANHHLVHGIEQLRAVQFQRRRHFIVVAVAVAAHPARDRVLHEVHALRVLLPVDRAVLLGEVVERPARRVRLRIELEQIRRRRVNAIGRNDVARERLTRPGAAGDRARGRIDERRGDRREVASPHGRCRQVEVVEERLAIDVALVVRHEEQPVLQHRARGRVAELMPLERRLRRRRPARP